MARNLPHLKITSQFDGATWLTPEQWDTYRRGVPVRYVRSIMKEELSQGKALCGHCQQEDYPSELQVAHRIGFTVGIVDWGLTPTWLNSPDNLVIAHRKTCNSALELTPGEIAARLVEVGVGYQDSPAVKSGLAVVHHDPATDEYSVTYP